MQVVVNEAKAITKTINDLPFRTAFKYREYWYIQINLMDSVITKCYDEFFDAHVIKDGWNEEAERFDDYVLCLHLGSQSFCYLRKDIKVAEYGTPTLSVALYQ